MRRPLMVVAFVLALSGIATAAKWWQFHRVYGVDVSYKVDPAVGIDVLLDWEISGFDPSDPNSTPDEVRIYLAVDGRVLYAHTRTGWEGSRYSYKYYVLPFDVAVGHKITGKVLAVNKGRVQRTTRRTVDSVWVSGEAGS